VTTAVRRAVTAVAALVACVSIASAAGARAASAAPPDAPSARAAGLGQTWETPQGTWAVVAMGHLQSRLNTFWQLFFRPAGTTRWSLVTPPGVASNGGFSADPTAGTSGTVVVGFQPSKHLHYSPLAETTDHGMHWRAGVLPSALVFAADAVAAGSGTTLALVRTDGGALVRGDGSITRWSTVATVATLGSTVAGRACKVLALRAVVVAEGAPEIGADCAKPGAVGLFREVRGTWVSSAPSVPGEGSSKLDVVRLWSDAGGTTALIEGRGAGEPSLVVAWRSSPVGRWTVSAPVRFAGDVLSTASGTASSLAVVTSAGWDAHTVEWIAGPGGRWRSASRPPAGTQAVAFAGGGLESLAVHGRRASVWQLGASGRWHETAGRVTVPIEYGSST
jgi:hypothetical protein